MGGEFTVARPAVKWKPMAAIKKEETSESASEGLFVVLEGIDGSGKTTLWQNLRNELGPDPRVRFLREPTELPSGLKIRACLQGKAPAPATDEEWMELFLTDRAANVQDNIQPALNEGRTVIQDRYIYSTAAYQARDAGQAQEILNRQKHFPEPDIVIYLELAPDRALQRIEKRLPEKEKEHFESRERLQRIYENYRSILPASCKRIDASLSESAVLELAVSAIRKATGLP
ncbi:MAG TPA: dTMP kinase [Leptospiraceae bacterium]|nr:dTMP kinase [Spirochaetaceae bacterium]HBS03951.1 dTMP kinase [Leptospiraceae bacterium]|tara:strand:- start:13989 stop:14681 length:693 start_codon:yes stop_codon:yes gene_type:complete